MGFFLNYPFFDGGADPTPSHASTCSNDILTKTLRDHFMLLDKTDSSSYNATRAFPILTATRSIFNGKTPYLLSKTDEVEEKPAKVILRNCPTWFFASKISLYVTDLLFAQQEVVKNGIEMIQRFEKSNNNNLQQDPSGIRNKYISR